jgi:hypothetical protein
VKKATIEMITEKIQKDIRDIKSEIYINKQEIKRLARKQRTLKDSSHKLHQILNKIVYEN